ncbi:MAG: magnesium chelatase subunit ChlI family protein [Bacillota bacterium]
MERLKHRRLPNPRKLSAAGLPQPDRYRLPGLNNGGLVVMRRAFSRLGMSMRAHDRVLKVARTITDSPSAFQTKLFQHL